MDEKKDGFWIDDHTFMPFDVFEAGLKRAEGESLPLTDRPGGKIIGRAKVVNGEFRMSVDDPEVLKLLSAPISEIHPGYSIQGPMTRKSAAEEWNGFLADTKRRFGP